MKKFIMIILGTVICFPIIFFLLPEIWREWKR